MERSCVICGVTTDLELDHIIPKSKGGSDEPSNKQWLCKRHNQEKRDKTSYYNFDKEVMKKMILESLEFDYDPYLNNGKVDPVKSYQKISKVFFILPKDFYDIYTEWKETKVKKEIEIKKLPKSDIRQVIDIIKDLDRISIDSDNSIKHINIPLEIIEKKCIENKVQDYEETLEKLFNEGLFFYPNKNHIQLV